ncbi:hypothetical protein FV232_21080 [Methylobacterium sp. WL30]|uniref:hypothetical protein n=1 Tax=unclassified Methylobacterium TaxID=2615210 RepID=UPI0011CC943E|nr:MULTISPECIES: hypothetical protein [unclassified Methylobacterium]TXM88803.1 hypothetical protein FV223_23515 [Methylobacterium sp. WL116]TXN22787.1 hypothetical protein FV225_26220 [Methylobacterium sp. WL93]TXN46527.1 hypothetical protein FV227_23210 [Methylobacterium sp. WL119]TXN64348.1 hypothetical protein FV232_21080 [Methylobacterium sp. WL30]
MMVGSRILLAAAGLLAFGALARADDTPGKPRDAAGSAEIGAQDRKPMEAPPGNVAKQDERTGMAPDVRDVRQDSMRAFSFPGGARF